MVHQKLSLALSLAAACLSASPALAQISESNWDPALTGAQQWQVNANWNTPTFPNDPGRVDSDPVMIDDVVGANVSVDLGDNLDLSVGSTDVTVAALRLGGTLGAVSTTISGGGGRLVFENYEQSDFTDPENPIYAFNMSDALIVSGGVVGSTNIISAPIHINQETLDIGSDGTNHSTNDLLISGPITFDNGLETASVFNNEAPGVTVTVTSNITIPDLIPSPGEDMANPFDFAFNQEPSSQGTIDYQGTISGAGSVQIGPRPANELPVSTFILNQNTISGGVSFGRTNLVLNHDDAFGTSTVRQNNNTNTFGANLISTSDSRVISNDMTLTQYVAIKGDHSLEWAGNINQTNSRGIVNLLPDGKTLTISGDIAMDNEDAPEKSAFPADDSPLYIGGTGKTIITGEIKNHALHNSLRRSFGVRGNAAVYINSTSNSYSGNTYIQGGNAHFADITSLGSTSRIKSTGGAVGLQNGTVTGPDTAAFMNLLRNRSQATPSGATGASANDLVRTDDFASGGLMLAASESAASLDFTGALANARDMSVAAPEQGMTFTGTITPGNSTYQLGGGVGVIELPNNNQLTGGNSVVIKNGLDRGEFKNLGGVKVTGTNDYTGSTTVRGKYLTSNVEVASEDGNGRDPDLFMGTTLTVTNIADGGVASGLGASSSSAGNLVLQGGTLRYEGTGDSTDRLFTIGTHGATIDSSGTGALDFTASSAVGVSVTATRGGILNQFEFPFEPGIGPASSSVIYDLPSTDDLVVGMGVTDVSGPGAPLLPEGTVITGILSPTRVQVSNVFGGINFLGNPSQVAFTEVARTLELTGSNADDNVLSPAITDSANGGLVGVTKSGSGKWILDGANTYTGDTVVEEGVLGVMDGVGTLAAGTNLNLMSGAALEIEIDGASSNDLLTVTGDATLSGMIDVSLLGFTPALNATFDVLTAASIVDDGLTIVGDGAFDFSIVGGTTLQLMFTGSGGGGLAGDYNSDGVVDAADYTVWRDNVGQPDGTLPNDDSLTGAIGQAHYDLWVSNYGSTAAGLASSLAAPEPHALVLAASLLAFCSPRRRAEG